MLCRACKLQNQRVLGAEGGRGLIYSVKEAYLNTCFTVQECWVTWWWWYIFFYSPLVWCFRKLSFMFKGDSGPWLKYRAEIRTLLAWLSLMSGSYLHSSVQQYWVQFWQNISHHILFVSQIRSVRIYFCFHTGTVVPNLVTFATQCFTTLNCCFSVTYWMHNQQHLKCFHFSFLLLLVETFSKLCSAVKYVILHQQTWIKSGLWLKHCNMH